MPFESWIPEVIIAIDFGMTCTGVAYSAGPEWREPKTITNWPGRATYETRNKVDTAVSYNSESRALQSWGFTCDDEDAANEVNRLFKLFLDPKFVDISGYAPTHAEVEQWYVDYLASLHTWVQHYCMERIPRFASKNVEWMFSIPTTWRDPGTIAGIERLVRRAGFEKQANHRVVIPMTEAEAAAIYVSKQQMQKGDVFLVCDAGGGTTDINLLKVVSAARGKTKLEPLHWNEGAAIGSTLIDYRVEKLLLERLQKIRWQLNTDLDSIVKDMIQGKFMSYKCAFGSSAADIPKLILPIPGLTSGQNIPYAGVENSSLVLTSGELQRIFDEQITKICDLLDTQLSLARGSLVGNGAFYLVLSGGLGSSPYVSARIRDRYEPRMPYGLENTQELNVLLAEEPQLAVVHGMALARVQALRGGPEILSLRKCPVSYGVLCREVYDPARHQGEEVEQDAFDKKRYAEDQIMWFIKQGQLVDVKEGIRQRFQRKIAPGKEKEPWRAKVVMSRLPPHRLPQSAMHDGVHRVCTVEAVLDLCDMSLRNNKWYHLGKTYRAAEFDVKLLVGTGLRFEIWGQQGCKSKAHEEINVEWEVSDERQVATQIWYAEKA